MRRSTRELVLFLEKHPTAALACISKRNTPQCATVFYFANAVLNFYFLTKTNSRKHESLIFNNLVALCITDESKLQTVQVEGRAMLVKDKLEREIAIDQLKLLQYGSHKYKNPPVNKLYGDFVFYKIVPAWLRWVDYDNGWTDASIYERTDFGSLADTTE